jgi:hypothetical protein
MGQAEFFWWLAAVGCSNIEGVRFFAKFRKLSEIYPDGWGEVCIRL